MKQSDAFSGKYPETVQLSVAQQIWGILQDLVTAIARVFGLLDEEILYLIFLE